MKPPSANWGLPGRLGVIRHRIRDPSSSSIPSTSRSTEETFDSSYNLFHTAFPEGFLWELMEVLSPPPNVVFKWRHWGQFKGNYKSFAPTGETIEIIGLSVARVTEELKIESVEHFFDNSAFLKKLTTSGCPFHS